MNLLNIIVLCLVCLTYLIKILEFIFVGRKLSFICKYCGAENEVQEEPLLSFSIGDVLIKAKDLKTAVEMFNEKFASLVKEKEK